MYKPLSKHTIDLLDRKFQFLMESQTETFLFDLRLFVNYLREDEIISYILTKLDRELEEACLIYIDKLKVEKIEVVKLKNELLKIHPELLETSRLIREKGEDWHQKAKSYEWELFYSLIQLDEQLVNYEEVNGKYDLTPSGQMMDFLNRICRDWKYINRKWKSNPKIHQKLSDLSSRHNHELREWRIFCKIAPANAFARLKATADGVNLSPNWFRNRETKEKSGLNISAFFNIQWTARNLPEVFNLGEDCEVYRNIRDNIETAVKRVYEAIREEIGTNLLHFQLINRYKVRSQIYNKAELRKIVEDKNNAGKFEDVLTLDLARFLFDSGLSTYYRVHAGSHEYDLIDLETNIANPLFVEAKAYTDNKAKQTLIKGIYQLHSYLCGVEAKKLIDEAYYVVFRVGGPIYVFPKKVQIGKFSIYPILIDLGESKDSGRKQPEPIEIKLQEISGFKEESVTEVDATKTD
jgi:hypothetical protein